MKPLALQDVEVLSSRTKEQFEKEPDLGRLSRAYAKISTDWPRAREEFEKLADIGSVMNMLYVADVYWRGLVTLRDLEEYERWLVRARDAGSASGAYKLGRFYLRQDRNADAIDNLLLSAKRGFIPALALLGNIYAKGERVPRDVLMAKSFLEEASRSGHSLAKRDLAGLLVANNFGLMQKVRAILLYATIPWEILKIANRHARLSDDGSSFRHTDERSN